MVAFASPQRKHQSYDFRLLEKIQFMRKVAENGSGSQTREPPPERPATDHWLHQWQGRGASPEQQ